MALLLRNLRCRVVAAILILGSGIPAAASGGPVALHLKPLRVLLVSGTQIRDDFVMDVGDDLERSDVIAIAALLKLWGVPFDVLRLDVHSLTLADIVDADGVARYGTIIWAARQDQYPWQPQDDSVLTAAALIKGVSIVAIGDRIRNPEIQRLLGVTYGDTGLLCDPVVLNDTAHSHFVIRGLEATSATLGTTFGAHGFIGARVTIEAGAGVMSLATACGVPQLTVRTVDAATRTRAVWLGGSSTAFAENPTFITLLRRALVFAVGYGVYKEYRDTVLLRMDDPGCAPSAYFACGYPRRYYSQLTQTDWNAKVLAPLRLHHARLGVLFCVGYPDPDHTHPVNTILPSCSVDAPDWALSCGGLPERNPQTITSTCAGLHDGVLAGLVEIQSHGYTHMQPDLTGWWNGNPKQQWNRIGWYSEFHNDVRDVDIDEAVQRQRLARSSAGIAAEFETPPLMFVPPGSSISGLNTATISIGRFKRFVRFVRFESPGASVPVTLRGAKPNARYTVRFGNERWLRLGTLVTDAHGNASASFSLPGNARERVTHEYVVVKRGATQFVAGPMPMAFESLALPLRARPQMTTAEQIRFRFATDALVTGGIGSGSLLVRVSGVVANTTYSVRFGSTSWTELGMLRTDATGGGHALLALPPSLLGSPAGQYVVLAREETQLIAGPTTSPLDLNLALPFRDRRHMTSEEQSHFARAGDSLVVGSVNASPFLPDHVAAAYTYKIAAESAFGVGHDYAGHYLGRDYVISLPQVGFVSAEIGGTKVRLVQQALDVLQRHFDRGVPGVIYHHDADVALDPQYYPRMLDRIHARWPKVYYLTPAEWSAYMHAAVGAAATAHGMRFDFEYDAHYARYFGAHASTWTLHLSDELLADVRGQGTIDVIVDGGAPRVVNASAWFTEKQDLSVPAGIGTHSVFVRHAEHGFRHEPPPVSESPMIGRRRGR